jgi:glycosyltransferase 2 family protein
MQPSPCSALAAPSPEIGCWMSRTLWAWARLLGGAAILGVLLWRLGTGPFLTGIRSINAWSLVATTAIAVLTTVCCAWRWCLVARGLGVGLPLRTAIAAYYRSQFLNSTLPGGVLGDVHRAVRHGRDAGNLGRGLRAVGWERTAGQVVQAILALVILSALPSPVRSSMRIVVIAAVAGALVVVLLFRALPRRGSSRWARTLRGTAADVRNGLLARPAWPGIVVASTVVVAGHAATFLIAARTAGEHASLIRMLPLAMLVLLATTVPTNVGGWGPREGVAAWAFSAAGLGASAGVTAGVVYGIMALVATSPGAVVLFVARRRSAGRQSEVTIDESSDAQPDASNETGPDASGKARVDASDVRRTASKDADRAAEPVGTAMRRRSPVTRKPEGARRG